MPRAREELATMQRRQEVARLYLRGITQVEIAARVGLNQSNVSRHLEAIRQEWLVSSVRAFDARKAEELAKIDRLEVIAWDAWERSCQNAESRRRATVKTVKGQSAAPPRGQAAEPAESPESAESDVQVRTWRTVKGQSGDPRFLERVAWCIQKRCEITGILDAPGVGPGTSVTVIGGIDLDVVVGKKPGLPHAARRPSAN